MPKDNVTDLNGFIDIPSEKSFYMVLMKDNLYVLNSRRNMLANSVYSLKLDEINKMRHLDKSEDGI